MSNKMTQKEILINFAERMAGDACRLLKTKNEDYSDGPDAFDHFDKLSKIAGIIGLDISKRHHDPLYRIIAKVLRLKALEDANPNHESVGDSCIDGIIFFIIYSAMLEEDKSE